MDAERQKSQQLAFTEESRGESPKAADEGIEASVAKREYESPAVEMELMEEVCEGRNLTKALKRVEANRGSAGVDGMRASELRGYLKDHWPRIREDLLSGSYKAQPVRRVEIPKEGGGVRQLGIPTVVERFIQQALLQALSKLWEPTFSEHSYGFRPGRSSHQAVAQAQQCVAEGHRWVVDIDLEKFFDRVDHDRLMSRLASRVGDKRILRVVRGLLNAGVMENGLVSPTIAGTPQGGPLSPLLSNIVLDELDRELESRGHRFVRYADDCNIYVRSERAGHRVMKSVRRFITGRLKLKVNDDKSAVGRPWQRKFLGFSFTSGHKPKRRISPEALQRVRRRVRELTRRTRAVSLAQMAQELSTYLRGWRGYYGYCQTPSVLGELDSWIRRRLRNVVWKQWKRGRRRYAALRLFGVSRALAVQTAGSSHGPWRLSRSPTLSYALPNAYFDTLGLPRLARTNNA
jgi:RNA-directed DNA polymerase